MLGKPEFDSGCRLVERPEGLVQGSRRSLDARKSVPSRESSGD